MRISLKQRIAPFSHQPGINLWIPFADVCLQAFPKKFLIEGLTLAIDIEGSVNGFTAIQDFEKKCVRIFGIAKCGYYQCKFFAEKSRIFFQIERMPMDSVTVLMGEKKVSLERKKLLELPLSCQTFTRTQERLSFGDYKQQNWEKISQKMSLKQLLPIWFAAGQLKITSGSSLPILSSDLHLPSTYLSVFKGLFARRSAEERNLDYPTISLDQKVFPELLQQSYLAIRKLFVQQTDSTIILLPELPSDLVCGRMTHVQCPGIGEIDFSWAKSRVRKVIIRAFQDTTVHWKIPEISRYRLLNFSTGKKANRAIDLPMSLESGKIYCLDHFEK